MLRNSRINNSHQLKANNRFAILDLLRRNGALSRKDIASQVMLTQASVTILTGELINENLIEETGIVRSAGVGRSKVLLNLNYERAYVVGIIIDTIGVEIAISQLQGKIIFSEKIPHRCKLGSIEILDSAVDIFNACVDKHGIKHEDIGCVGVGTIGLVDSETGVSLYSYGVLPPDTPIAKILGEKFQLPVAVDNVVRAIAIAELDFRRVPANISGLFIKYGPGVGSAIIVENDIYYGVSNRSGEIGHCIVEPTRERCICGKRGCLEQLIGLDSLKAQAGTVFDRITSPHLFELCEGLRSNITIEHIVEAADRGDTALTVILERALYYLSISIVNAIEVVDGKQIILFGYLFHKDWAYKRLSEILADMGGHRIPIEIVKSIHIGESPCIGSVAIAIRRYFASV